MNDINVEKFKNWLNAQGAIVLDPTNPYELVRFKTDNGVSVVYTGKRGTSFVGEAEAAYGRFQAGKGWRVVSRKRENLRARKARLAARDGKRCFAHGEKMRFDQLTIEHLLNFSHGGSDNENNLALVCDPCNQELGNLPITKKIEKMIQLRRAYVQSIQAQESTGSTTDCDAIEADPPVADGAGDRTGADTHADGRGRRGSIRAYFIPTNGMAPTEL